MNRRTSCWSVFMLGAAAWLFATGCPELCFPPPPSDPEDFTSADGVRGGLLYDKWWKVAAGATEPSADHPLYPAAGAKSGSKTWRCKECHGWDYQGAAGAYASGSHLTGIAGIYGTTKTAQEVFDLIKTDHGFGSAGLSDSDIWDLTKFVKQQLIDVSLYIDASKSFVGNTTNGKTLYDDGVGSNTPCANTACHGREGRLMEFEPGVYLGDLARKDPWETLHKTRFGHPGSQMPSSVSGGGSTQDAADIGAYAQTIGQAGGDGQDGQQADPTAGAAFYTANDCAACHGADASGGIGPSLSGVTAAEILARLDGTQSHPGGTVAGVTQQNADDLAAWIATP